MTTEGDYTMGFKGLTVNTSKRSKAARVESEQEALELRDEAAAVKEESKKEKHASSFIDQILIIAGFAIGAILISNLFAGIATGRGDEIAAKIREGSSSSSISESGDGTSTTTDETAPAASTPSLDISGALPYLGYAGLGAGGVGITVLGIGGAKKLRRRKLELRELEEARAEDRRKAQAAWQKYADIHSELKAKILEAETDWDMLFKYPTLVDATVPQTRELHRAIRAVDAAPADAPAELNLSMDIGSLPYPKLVMEAQEAWNAAWSFAQRTGTKLIPKPERKKIDQIVQLLKLARDGGGSEHERSVAYERASKLIGELHFVRVPEIAMRSIEAERRRMIEAPLESSGAEPRTAERVVAL